VSYQFAIVEDILSGPLTNDFAREQNTVLVKITDAKACLI
jgi:hypothetical protein